MGISRNWATAHFLTLMVSLGTVMASVGVSFSLLMCYSECMYSECMCYSECIGSRSSGSGLVHHLGPSWF